MGKRFFLVLAFCCLLLSLNSCNERSISLSMLLNDMASYETPANYPEIPYKTYQISSYDRRTVSPDKPGWFANDDGFGFERLDTIGGRVEKVLFDEDGPGVITRIWMTTRDKRGSLRFYFDGSNTAGITIPAYDMDKFPVQIGEPLSLTHTHYSEEIEGIGGNTFFLPIPFGKSCKITLEEPDMNAGIPRYYQIVYRKYSQNVRVETFTLKEAESQLPLIREVSRKLLNPVNYDDGKEYSAVLDSPDVLESQVLLPEGRKAINNLTLTLSECDSSEVAEVMSRLRIKIFFDGAECVDCPVDCFFGAGTGAPVISDWYMSSDGKGKFVSRWLMPYADSSRICLINESSSAFKAKLSCFTDDYDFTDNTLYFHVSYNEEDSVRISNDYSSNSAREWNFVKIDGRGVYCGDVLSVYNHSPAWYGEGDEKIWVDDDDFPSTMGTGTEDYYNCSWAPVKPFNTPFGGAPRADEESSHGYNTFMRTRNLDLIPFEKKFVFNLEMLCWVPGVVDMRAAAFWYGDESAVAE